MIGWRSGYTVGKEEVRLDKGKIKVNYQEDLKEHMRVALRKRKRSMNGGRVTG